MPQTKIIKIEVTASEARNIIQGLDLLHSKCIDLLQSVKPFEKGANDVKEYFKDKQAQLAAQIRETNKLLNI